jgi:DnaJ domain/PilZ domain
MSDTLPNSDAPQGHDEHHMRAEPRLGTDDLHCSKGRVADITGSGMRVIIGPKDLPQIGDVQSYTFFDGTDLLTVTGTVKWVRKGTIFTRKCEIGIEFVKLEPAVRESILRLAIHGKIGETEQGEIQIAYPDLYKVLGANPHASMGELQAAYRKAARTWHPDVNDQPGAAQRFEEISKAYAVLSNEQTRASYNARFFNPTPSTDQHAA